VPPPADPRARRRGDPPPERQRLILRLPPDLAPARLASALEAGDVAAAVVVRGTATTAALVDLAQREGVAALVAHEAVHGAAPAWPLGYGADGLHLSGDEALMARVARDRPEGATLGAAVATRHGAMTLGESGVDYVWFGSTDALDADLLEQACWWQALFEVPAVAAGPVASVRSLIATRVEFIAVNVFDDSDPAGLVEAINRDLDHAGGPR
jgi:thiamine-phosphate pyrophosphorylase